MYQHKKQAIHLQATSKIQQAIMASRRSPYVYSPSIGTMPQTYRKLSSSWDANAKPLPSLRQAPWMVRQQAAGFMTPAEAALHADDLTRRDRFSTF